MEAMSSRDAEPRRTVVDPGASCSSTSVWDEIDVAESYLVCCKFEAASSLSRSIIHRFCNCNSTKWIEDAELVDIAESAGMVFVQSQRELGRTSELITELKCTFGSAALIPGQVFLTGACMQIAEGFLSDLKSTFEEFIGKWKYVEGHAFVFPNEENNSTSLKCPFLAAEKYFDIVGVYVVSLLGIALKDIDLAASWTERAELPEERRQEILRKLQSLSFSKSSSSPTTEMQQRADKTLKSLQGAMNLSTKIDSAKNPNGETLKAVMLGSPLFSFWNRIAGNLWWVRSIRFKCGNTTLIIPPAKILLWTSLVLAILHIFRRKHGLLRRFVGDKVAVMKRALFDAWRLAFSVQVNPLAAIQPMPTNAAPRS